MTHDDTGGMRGKKKSLLYSRLTLRLRSGVFPFVTSRAALERIRVAPPALVRTIIAYLDLHSGRFSLIVTARFIFLPSHLPSRSRGVPRPPFECN